MKRPFRYLAVVAGLLLLALLARATLFRDRPVAVEVASAEIGAVEDVVANSEAGSVKARSRARLGVQSAGRVAEIPHREGSTVRSGDLLLRLEPTTERTRIQAAYRNREVQRAALATARSAAGLTHRTLERISSLRTQGLASEAQLDDAKAQSSAAESEVRAAEARLRSADTAIRLAQDELTHAEIRAPFDGTISHRLIEIGEEVSPGQTLLELVSLSRLYVSAPIDERDAGRLELGLPARVTVDTYAGVTWASRLTRISPVIDASKEQNRIQEVEVDLPPDSTGPQPRPGMTADVEVILERRERVLRVPTLAVIDGTRVLLFQNGRAVSRQVGVGLRNWEWSEIRSGLAEGDRVITSLDRAGVREGAHVQAGDGVHR